MSDSFDPLSGETPGDPTSPPGGPTSPPGGPGLPPGGPAEPPERSSRGLYWLLGLLLVAVLVVIGFLSVIVFGDDEQAVDSSTTSEAVATTTSAVAEETTTTVVDETTTTVAEETTTTTEQETTTTTAVDRPDVRSPEDAAKAYVTALGTGDTETGWVLLSPEAQAEVGSYETFEGFSTEFIEGFGAWSRATDLDIYENVMATGVAGDVIVVTFAGDVNAEGITSFATLAIPVRESASGLYEVLWFFPSERTTFVAPEGADPPAVFPADGTFEVLVPEGVTTVKFAVNDLGAIDGDLASPSGGTIRATVTPSGDLPSGQHVLTVFTIAGDIMVADAVPFVVE